jgi:pilus assembly protein CpaC
VAVANPDVADVVVIGEREVVINGKVSGETDVLIVGTGFARRQYRVIVKSTTERRQIALAVKIAEVRRDRLAELGVNLLARGTGDALVRGGTGQFRNDNLINQTTGAITVPEGRFASFLTDFGADGILAFIDAEETRGNARSLAEPTILAANREEASFLAGGELPIPIVAGGGGGQVPQVSVQYRPFGVQLSFTGEIISDTLVKLKVRPEVSTLDYANAILFQGFRIPAVRSRRVESTVDVRTNSSLVLSGLLNDEREQVRTGVPFLMNLPILGNLFSSTRWQKNETELLIIVTPTIIDPNRPRARDLVPLQPDTILPARPAIEPRMRTTSPPPVPAARP